MADLEEDQSDTDMENNWLVMEILQKDEEHHPKLLHLELMSSHHLSQIMICYDYNLALPFTIVVT